MASPPQSVDEVDPMQHASEPLLIVSGQNDIPIWKSEQPSSSAATPPAPPPAPASSTSPPSVPASASRKLPPVPKFLPENSSEGGPSSSSSAALVRQLPPVPKFSVDSSSMGPPPSKSSSPSSRASMGPPPVPKFDSLAMGPPKVSPNSKSSSDKLSESVEPSRSEEENAKAVELSIAGGGDDAPAAQGNGVSAVEGTSRLSLAVEGNERQLYLAGANSGSSSGQLPYLKPSWSAAPGQPYTLEILKEGNIVGVEDVSKKGAYMFGRSDRCDFVLEHPTVSRYHAVLQYSSNGDSFLYDLGSTHGTFVNKLQVKGREYVPLHVGDILRFGFSSRLHLFQGPQELMPEEGLTKKERQAQRLVEAAQDRSIREASLMRGKRDSMASDGISWGMQEDAEEEAEENVEEVTWQTFKGELTEKQQKTLGKIHKYNEKLSNLRKENDAIQAKEISQGGLTQGQQTQVARNDQRMEQLVEEVDNLEETLNDSIQESISGRSGLKRRGKKNSVDDDEEDDLSDDDEFYDRASKGQPRKKKEVVQKVETADSLLDQRAALTIEIENLREAIKAEEKTSSLSEEGEVAKMEVETEDPLDQFMTHLSSTIVQDKASHLQKELDSLSKELGRVERLLRLADPTGESLKKWELKKSVEGNQEAEIQKRELKRIFPSEKDAQELATSVAGFKTDHIDGQVGTRDGGDLKANDNADNSAPSEEDTTVLPGLEAPLRLGAPMPEASEEVKPEVSARVNEEAGNFVTYKERKTAIGSNGGPQISVAQVVVVKDEGQRSTETETEEDVSPVDLHVADSVALLLRQKRGLVPEESDVFRDTQQKIPVAGVEDRSKQSKKRKKQGPSKMPHSADIDSAEDWVPPSGQTGDGRTALNDKYGY